MQRMLALLLLGASVPAGADIYKWTDENGRVHFGDSAAGAGKKTETVVPSGGAARRATDTGATPDAEQMKERQRRLLEVMQREEAEREAAARRQAEAKRRQDSECQRLRDALEKMDGRVVATIGKDGEPQYLDDAQRQGYVDKANLYLEQHCK